MHADFVTEKARAPIDLKHIIVDVPFLEYQHRSPFDRQMVREILRRAGITGKGYHQFKQQRLSQPTGAGPQIQSPAHQEQQSQQQQPQEQSHREAGDHTCMARTSAPGQPSTSLKGGWHDM